MRVPENKVDESDKSATKTKRKIFAVENFQYSNFYIFMSIYILCCCGLFFREVFIEKTNSAVKKKSAKAQAAKPTSDLLN